MPMQNDKTELDLLNTTHDEMVINQSAFCERLGAVSSPVNFMMMRAIGKGLITIKKVPVRRCATLLRPKGFAEKARLVADFANKSMGMIREVRVDFAGIFIDAKQSDGGSPRYVTLGDLKMSEIELLEFCGVRSSGQIRSDLAFDEIVQLRGVSTLLKYATQRAN